jgi:hypothetical protein
MSTSAEKNHPLLTPATASKLLTSDEAASRLGILPQSLRIRRLRGGGPPYIRLSDSASARVFYPLDEFEGWLAARPRHVSTGEERASRAAAGGAS